MEYRIRKQYYRDGDRLDHKFYIQRHVNLFLFKMWIKVETAPQGYSYIIFFSTQEEAEAHIQWMCRRDKLVIPETETVKELNCNEI